MSGNKENKGLKVNKSIKGNKGASNRTLEGITTLVLIALSTSLSS